MAFTLPHFAGSRPYLFHLTDQRNIHAIGRSRVLRSAENLMKEASSNRYRRQKRPTSQSIQIDGVTIYIRDQRPLYEGNITFEGGWSFEDVIHSLNMRVFFWPGKAAGPIDYGQRHYERYAHERPVIVRVPTSDVFAANDRNAPMFCRFNSGSPRCSKGLGSPRGPNTFVKCDDADFTSSKVVEVTFSDEVELPGTAEISRSPRGPWRSLLAVEVTE